MNTRIKKVDVLGVPFIALNLEQTAELLARRVADRQKVQVVTANPEIVMAARKDPHLLDILQGSSLVTPDGIGIVWAAKRLGNPLPERVAGYDLLHALMRRADRKAWNVFLFGASEAANAGAYEALRKKYPQANLVGRRNGFFAEEDIPEIIEEINRCRPDLLFVGLGAPKQEQWIANHLDKLQVQVAMGVGGSFDVLAGKVKRAPLLWQKMHVEWLYRLLSQPSRWRRQLSLPLFVWQVLKTRKNKR